MHGLILCDWTTLQGTSTSTTIVQSESRYLDLAAYEDFVAWIEVMDLASGGGLAKIFLETAPLKDEALFAAPSGFTQTNIALAVGTVTARNLFNSRPASQVPLARWLRWRIDMSGASSTWNVTFRVHVAAHSMCLPDR